MILPHTVVVGLDCITGLQTARILARHGIPTIGLAEDPQHFCCRTRVCERVVGVPGGADGVVESLAAIGPQLRERAVLFPCTDPYVLAISESRETLGEWFHIVLPEHDVVSMLMDKGRFARHAVETGLRIPATRVVATRAEAEEAAASLTFPCMVKPAQKTDAWRRHAGVKGLLAADAEEFLSLFDVCGAWTTELVVQEWIVGGEENLVSCNCYFDRESRPLVAFVARKLRQWPLDMGTSSLGEECRNDLVRETTLRLFGEVKYQGLGYLEMKKDDRTGDYGIIEPNIGRPTGRSAIAEAGGVDLLLAAYCDALGRPLPTNLEQRYTGAKWIYWRADLQAAAVRWKRGELGVREWWSSIRGRRTDAVLSWSDPLPFVLDLSNSLRHASRLGFESVRTRSRAIAAVDTGPRQRISSGAPASGHGGRPPRFRPPE